MCLISIDIGSVRLAKTMLIRVWRGDRGLAYSYQLLYSNELALQMVPIVNLKLTIDVNIRVPDPTSALVVKGTCAQRRPHF